MSDRPILLDLFCCEGGASMGYHRAGFEVVGVDARPMSRYPFAFVQSDAFRALEAGTWRGAAAIHASPPCQAWSRGRLVHKRTDHPELIDPIRRALDAIGLPYVIENVERAPIRADLTLCGSMFEGVRVRRHRLFESNVDLGWPPMACSCERQTRDGYLFNVHNTDQRDAYMRRYGYTSALLAKQEAMGVPWMSDDGTQEAIPPAYTEFIGARLMAALTTYAPDPAEASPRGIGASGAADDSEGTPPALPTSAAPAIP